MIVREMPHNECAEVLASSRLGRLACIEDDQPYIVPIHFAFHGNFIYSFSMPGQKIDWMRSNSKVCLQVDAFTDPLAWKSVNVYGVYEELPDRIGWKHERERAWSLLEKHVNWWEPGALKPAPAPAASNSSHIFYRIEIKRMTGRQALDEQN